LHSRRCRCDATARSWCRRSGRGHYENGLDRAIATGLVTTEAGSTVEAAVGGVLPETGEYHIVVDRPAPGPAA
jgi:hypothetical protein